MRVECERMAPKRTRWVTPKPKHGPQNKTNNHLECDCVRNWQTTPVRLLNFNYGSGCVR